VAPGRTDKWTWLPGENKMLFFDPVYFLFVGPAILVSMWATFVVKSTFARYTKERTRGGVSGAQAAREILRANGITDVSVEQVSGFLSDHYDPRKKVLRLSPDVYSGTTVAAVGVAAHEVGHALQHSQGYAPLAIRSSLVPVASLGSQLSWILIVVGFVIKPLLLVGIALFGASVLFSLVTLPVEFNASSRAMVQISTLGLLSAEEEKGARKVLSAAAMTYVAAAITAVLTLLYFLHRAGLLGGRNN
jgi:hypothetical protein